MSDSNDRYQWFTFGGNDQTFNTIVGRILKYDSNGNAVRYDGYQYDESGNIVSNGGSPIAVAIKTKTVGTSKLVYAGVLGAVGCIKILALDCTEGSPVYALPNGTVSGAPVYSGTCPPVVGIAIESSPVGSLIPTLCVVATKSV